MITKKEENLYELEFDNEDYYIKAELIVDNNCLVINVQELNLQTLETIEYHLLKGPMIWSYYTNNYYHKGYYMDNTSIVVTFYLDF